MSCTEQDLTIIKGKTFSRVVRWETTPIVYKPITGIAQAAPAVVTVVNHELPPGWRVAIVSVQGMFEINAQNTPPRNSDYTLASLIDPDTISLNEVNAAEFSAYDSGGYVQYNTPHDLTGYTARMQIRPSYTSATILLELTTANSRIILDNLDKVITLQIAATDTDDITWKSGVYDLEMVSPSAVVTQLLRGNVVVLEEATK